MVTKYYFMIEIHFTADIPNVDAKRIKDYTEASWWTLQNIKTQQEAEKLLF